MTEDEVFRFVAGLSGVIAVTASEENGDPEVSWGDSFFYYEPAGTVPRRQPFATIVVKDYPGYDTASGLDRSGAFRVNIAVGRDRLDELTGGSYAEDAAPAGEGGAAGAASGRLDYAVRDRVLPHPVYAAQGWAAIVEPGRATGGLCRALLAEAHARAAGRYRARA